MRKIAITAGAVSLHTTLDASETAQRIWQALALESRGNTWDGDPAVFRKVRSSTIVRVERVSPGGASPPGEPGGKIPTPARAA